ncbi:MAG TPA: glucose 1-dehydrogenase [Planctomycetota bacterium]|nr:glucose 1-dehydrogenase [Planctomycetota bacterium]
MGRFEGKVALVTGGNSGIGLAAAKAFAREGASVVITGRNDGSLKSAAKEIGSGTLALRADAAKLSDLDALMAQVKSRFGRIDALFVNAGIGKFVPFDQVTEAFYDEIMDVNVKGLFFTVHKALPLLGPGSAVVLNASINGHKGMPGTTVYGASKAAVLNLARTMSADLVSRGIRVNSISPGPIDSALLSRLGMPDEKLKETQDWIRGQVPMRRFGTGEEIAEAVLYLCSPGAGFTIGADLVIDGGMLL